MDGAIRNLERALGGGDEQARLPLASAYQRLGHVVDALRVLAEAPAPEGELLALLEETWRGELSRLAPASRIDGARPCGELWGWSASRAVLLTSLLERRSGLLGVADFDVGKFVYESAPTGPLLRGPVAASPHELLLHAAPGVLSRLDIATGRIEDERLAAGGSVLELDSVRERALVRHREPGRRLVFAILRLGDGAEEFYARGGPRLSVVINWSEHWAAWRDPPGPLRWTQIPLPEPQPLYSGGPEAAGEISSARGSLTPIGVVGPYLVARGSAGGLLVDPIRGTRHELPDFPGSVHGPWRLSASGDALLAYRLGVPVALPLSGAPLRQLALPGGPGISRAFWHPSADLVALGRRGEGSQLRSLSGEIWLHLPRDAQVLGWDPPGHSLVVLRQLGSVGGLLERWTPGGTS